MTRGPIIFAARGPLRATRKDQVTLRFLMVSEAESQRNVKVFLIEGISYGMSQLPSPLRAVENFSSPLYFSGPISAMEMLIPFEVNL